MEVFNDLFQTVKDLGLYALFCAALLKIATSLAVAMTASAFNWPEFGEMFRKDFVKLLTVTALVILYPNDAANALIVTAYIAYLGTRTIANIGALLPEVGEFLPQSFQGAPPADTPPTTPEEGVVQVDAAPIVVVTDDTTKV